MPRDAKAQPDSPNGLGQQSNATPFWPQADELGEGGGPTTTDTRLSTTIADRVS